MLRIALGSEYLEKWLTPEELKIYIDEVQGHFKFRKKPEWFRDEFAKRVIGQIDKADIIADYALKSQEFNFGYSVDDLSGGAKTLLNMYYDRNYIYMAYMGENCIDFLEEIAASYEKEGKDLTIVSNWLMEFNFKYINKIYFINWGITCYNQDDIDDKIFGKWYKQEKDTNEDEDYLTEIELKAMSELLKRVGADDK